MLAQAKKYYANIVIAVLAPCSRALKSFEGCESRHDRSSCVIWRNHGGRDPGGVRAVEFARPR